MPTLKRKAVAYITWKRSLLVFSHPDFPEAGIQVPAGTIEPGESVEAAALREAFEETGLAGLEMVAFLGQHRYDMTAFGKDEMHERHFYHLRCTETPPAAWIHHERNPSDGGPPIRFVFFWASLPDAMPPLIAGQGDFLPALVLQMG